MSSANIAAYPDPFKPEQCLQYHWLNIDQFQYILMVKQVVNSSGPSILTPRKEKCIATVDKILF